MSVVAAPPEFRVSPPVAGVIAAIETDVILGRILPKMRLIEDHLMEDYDSKRHVIRAALVELERLGVVVKPPHRGAELRSFDASDLAQLYATRAVLHRAAVSMMTLPPSNTVAEKLRAACSRHMAAAAKRDVISIHRTNMAFHRTFFSLCDNQYLAASIRHHDWLSFPARAYGASNIEALTLACKEHRQMVEAALNADAAALQILAVQHMDRARLIYEEKFLPSSL